MAEHRIAHRKQRMAQTRTPSQQRSWQRREDILQTTAALLERVGFDDLTTILIAAEMGISVGTLYHYFPNKQSILYALGERWLEQQTAALETIAAAPLEQLTIAEFIELAFKHMLTAYREQRGLLPLVQAMWAVPELRDLDDHHDEIIISYLERMFQRIGLKHSKLERRRRARLILEMTHALFLTVVEQTPAQAKRSFEDVKSLGVTLLERT
ncbi:MAG: TetR/AcrR family transcriptional regulator [Pseudomonadota bacterium]